MAQSAIDITKYLVLKAQNTEGSDFLSNLKVQKLLYYCQGFFYAKNQEKLFNEDIVAWQYGPVVTEVYHELKEFGQSGISLDVSSDFNIDFSDKEREMVDEVFNYFNQFSAIKLMNMTHEESPWIDTPLKSVITLDKLKKHFEEFLVDE